MRISMAVAKERPRRRSVDKVYFTIRCTTLLRASLLLTSVIAPAQSVPSEVAEVAESSDQATTSPAQQDAGEPDKATAARIMKSADRTVSL